MVTKEEVMNAMRECYDPEIPVNIVDLGLVYNVDVTPENAVNIKMTMTSPGCPMHGMIEEDVKNRVTALGAKEVKVDIVWEPPWNPETMMSEEAKQKLGLMR